MLTVLTCIFVQHDLRLVVVAALICATACSAAFGFHLRSLRSAGSPIKWAWMGLTGLVAGSGVWATHFIAMLAYLPGVPIGYQIYSTVLSLAVAIAGMAVGFALPVLAPGRAAVLTGGVVTGSSVAAMHFIGIDAIRTQARMEWDAAYVVASVLIGALGAAAAFYARSRLRGRAQWAGSAAVLVGGIVGLHFTAMAAVTLVPDPSVAFPADLVGRGPLAMATVALAVLILAAASSLIWMERMGRRSTLHGVRDALDALSAGLAFYDQGGRLMSWNKAFADLMGETGVRVSDGMTRAEFAEAAITAGWQPQGEADREARRRESYTKGMRTPAADVLLPDGRWIRHEVFSTPEGGSVTVMTDVTEQQEAARALAEARDSAEAANRAKTQFLANMSHEIRTPLNGLLGVADVLAAGKLSAKQQELVSVIRSSGGLLNALLTDLLDLARVEAGVVDLHAEPVSVAEVVASVAGLYRAQAEQKGLKLSAEIEGAAGAWATCDGIRLRQVLGNLVSNAVKFTETGHVTLAATRDRDDVTFRVRDTGVGFDAARKATLFGRFEQGDDSSTRKHGGAGLGLAICQQYVRLMGGTLDATSTPGEGSEFVFTLRLPAQAEPAPAIEPAEEASVQPVEQAGGGRFRVLVVDDNEVNRQVLGLILDSIGIEHAEAEDGLQGFESARTGGFDLVLMDLQMPVMDGFESMRRIRAWEREAGRGRMPIYVVSANCLQEHVDEGAAAGADGHLPKPISVPHLIAALQPHAAASLAA